MGGVVAAVVTFFAEASVPAIIGAVGTAMTVVGAVTGSKDLMQIGGVLGLAGGIGSFVSSMAEVGTASVGSLDALDVADAAQGQAMTANELANAAPGVAPTELATTAPSALSANQIDGALGASNFLGPTETYNQLVQNEAMARAAATPEVTVSGTPAATSNAATPAAAPGGAPAAAPGGYGGSGLKMPGATSGTGSGLRLGVTDAAANTGGGVLNTVLKAAKDYGSLIGPVIQGAFGQGKNEAEIAYMRSLMETRLPADANLTNTQADILKQQMANASAVPSGGIAGPNSQSNVFGNFGNFTGLINSRRKPATAPA
jgi:hypothetical protein